MPGPPAEFCGGGAAACWAVLLALASLRLPPIHRPETTVPHTVPTGLPPGDPAAPSDLAVRHLAGLRRHMKETQPGVYLNLVSLLQSLVLGGVLVEASSVLVWSAEPASILGWVVVVTSLLPPVIAWQENTTGCYIFRWVPDLRDTLLPFALGLSEFLLIPFLDGPLEAWFLAFAAFFALGCISERHQHRRATSEPENAAILQSLRRHLRFAELAPLVGFVYCLGATAFIATAAPAVGVRIALVAPVLVSCVGFLVRAHVFLVALRDASRAAEAMTDGYAGGSFPAPG